MKRTLITTLTIVLVGYVVLCGLLYALQEKLIFFPEKLEKKYKFGFDEKFEELNFKMNDGEFLNGVLFKADTSKGLIFYLHGNAGSIGSWGYAAKVYTDLGYDVLMLDYRGYGKSGGSIKSQEQLFEDNQVVYNALKLRYREDQIIVLGYSLGSGLASKLASTNNPRLLILQAPYYSLTDIMKRSFSFIPTFILKYKLPTNIYLKDCAMPVIIFHGDEDEVIYFGASLKLKDEFGGRITLIPLEGQGHNGMTDNPNYRRELRKILTQQ